MNAQRGTKEKTDAQGAATAIQDGLVTPDTEIDVPSVLAIGRTRFTDVDPHGDVRMTVTDILRQSSNIGTIKIAERLSKDQLANSLRSFGLGATTSVQFPGQASGLLLEAGFLAIFFAPWRLCLW